MTNQTNAAWSDLANGATNVRAWWALAWDDLRSRYQRTILGPFWVTLSHAAAVGGLAIWSSLLMKQPLADAFLYVAAGLTVWALISTSLIEASNTFIRAAAFISAYDLPIALQVFRIVTGQVIAFAHNMIVFLVAVVYVGHVPTMTTLLAIPGLLLLILVCISWTFCLGVAGARFRDIAPLISSVVGMLMILTPVFWRKNDIVGAEWLAQANPLYHLLQIVRAPLLGQTPAPENWYVSLAILLVSGGAALVIFTQNRRHLAYWL